MKIKKMGKNFIYYVVIGSVFLGIGLGTGLGVGLKDSFKVPESLNLTFRSVDLNSETTVFAANIANTNSYYYSNLSSVSEDSSDAGITVTFGSETQPTITFSVPASTTQKSIYNVITTPKTGSTYLDVYVPVLYGIEGIAYYMDLRNTRSSLYENYLLINGFGNFDTATKKFTSEKDTSNLVNYTISPESLSLVMLFNYS